MPSNMSRIGIADGRIASPAGAAAKPAAAIAIPIFFMAIPVFAQPTPGRLNTQTGNAPLVFPTRGLVFRELSDRSGLLYQRISASG